MDIELIEFADRVRFDFKKIAPAKIRISETDPTVDFQKLLEDWVANGAQEHRPEPLPFGVSPRGAELYVAEWLKWLGFADIQVTDFSRDGGYDISAGPYLIQVKNWTKSWLPVAAVREIFGVATLASKQAMIFSAGFLSEDAAQFAESASIPVFMFSAEESILKPANESAESVFKAGLQRKFASKVIPDLAVLLAKNELSLDFLEAALQALILMVEASSDAERELNALLEALVALKYEPWFGGAEKILASLLAVDQIEDLMAVWCSARIYNNLIRAAYKTAYKLCSARTFEITSAIAAARRDALALP